MVAHVPCQRTSIVQVRSMHNPAAQHHARCEGAGNVLDLDLWICISVNGLCLDTRCESSNPSLGHRTQQLCTSGATRWSMDAQATTMHT